VPDESLTPAQAAQLGRLVDVYPEARELGERFESAGHELYLVGGTVRDTLLAGGDAASIEGMDLDFTTSARPEETEKILRRWADTVWLTGAKFGTVSAERRRRGHPPRQVEITTFRSDEYAPGSRHPEVTYGDDIAADLSRRDFTVNAMAVRVPQFLFVDAFGGLVDLNRRTCCDPRRPARVVRGRPAADGAPRPLRRPVRRRARPRHAGRRDRDARPADVHVGRAHPRRAREARRRRPPGRAACSCSSTPGWPTTSCRSCGSCAACRDPIHRHKDVWLHTLAVVENVMDLEDDGPDVVLRLAALLHDIGKPDTRRILKTATSPSTTTRSSGRG
jgi:poly(A) polymerase